MTQANSSLAGAAPGARTDIGIAQVATSVLAFAALPILVKLGLRQDLGIWQLLLLRCTLGGLGLMALVWLIRGGYAVRRAMTPKPILVGLLFCATSAFFFGSLQYVSASLAVLLLFIHPALVAFAKHILSDEAPDWRTLTALISSLAGSALLVTSFHVRTAVGLAVCIAVPLSYAAFLVVAERTGSDLGPLATSATTLIVGIPVMTMASFVFAGSVSLPATRDGWLIALGITACPMIGIPALVGALRRLGATRTAIVGTAEPLVTLVLAAVLLSERLSFREALGGALILCAGFGAIASAKTASASPSKLLDPGRG